MCAQFWACGHCSASAYKRERGWKGLLKSLPLRILPTKLKFVLNGELARSILCLSWIKNVLFPIDVTNAVHCQTRIKCWKHEHFWTGLFVSGRTGGFCIAFIFLLFSRIGWGLVPSSDMLLPGRQGQQGIFLAADEGMPYPAMSLSHGTLLSRFKQVSHFWYGICKFNDQPSIVMTVILNFGLMAIHALRKYKVL